MSPSITTCSNTDVQLYQSHQRPIRQQRHPANSRTQQLVVQPLTVLLHLATSPKCGTAGCAHMQLLIPEDQWHHLHHPTASAQLIAAAGSELLPHAVPLLAQRSRCVPVALCHHPHSSAQPAHSVSMAKEAPTPDASAALSARHPAECSDATSPTTVLADASNPAPRRSAGNRPGRWGAAQPVTATPPLHQCWGQAHQVPSSSVETQQPRGRTHQASAAPVDICTVSALCSQLGRQAPSSITCQSTSPSWCSFRTRPSGRTLPNQLMLSQSAVKLWQLQLSDSKCSVHELYQAGSTVHLSVA